MQYEEEREDRLQSPVSVNYVEVMWDYVDVMPTITVIIFLGMIKIYLIILQLKKLCFQHVSHFPGQLQYQLCQESGHI